MTSTEKKEPPGSGGSSSDEVALCRCGHGPAAHDKLQRWTCIGNRNLCGCKGYLPQGGAEEPEEDPYTGEAGNCGTCTSRRPEGEEEGPKPRPPYAVAYSVDGRLFEAWLPGDATAVAEDGGLIIKHDAPVIGIVRVAPVREA